MELMWCSYNSHEVPRSAFTRPASSVENHQMCNPCYLQLLDQQDYESDEEFPVPVLHLSPPFNLLAVVLLPRS